MAHRVFLYQNYISTGPKWWINFFNEVLKAPAGIEEINQFLKPYSAEFFCGMNDDYAFIGPRELEFETKEDFTAFVLRWS